MRLLFLRDTNSSSSTAGSLGVLTSDSETPVVTKTSVSPDLLQALQIFTKLVVQKISHYLVGLTVFDILLPIQEPVGNLVLTRVLHNGDDFLNLLFAQLTSALVKINVGLLEDKVGITTTTTLDSGHGEHNVPLAVNVGVHNTQNMLKRTRNNQRHDGCLFVRKF